ncbi:MAG: AAA family ATPase [Minicystis sp.]
MLVQGLTVTDVKCFSPETTIDLMAGRESPHKWVVIYGGNGLGKSTLLRAFGIALTGQPALNALFPSTEGWVRSPATQAWIGVRIQKTSGDKSPGAPRVRPIGLGVGLVGPHYLENNAVVYPAHSVFPYENWQNIEKRGQRKETKQLNEDVKLFKEHISSDEPKRGWLLCGYGPHRRLSGASSELSERIPPEGRAARLITLFHEGAALTSSERWLIKLQHYALRDKGAAKRRLEAIIQIINTSLLHGDVVLDEITPEGVTFKTPFSSKIPFGDLSDGYRSVLALTLDLLRHVEYAFEIESVLEFKEGRAVVTAEGVVLIDEIDAHLHPSWQRTIGAWLHERFPNMQFIVTTHSPLIATRVSDTEGLVVRLVRRKIQRGKEFVDVVTEEGTIGRTVDQHLTSPSFGLTTTRDVLAEEKAAEIERLRARVQTKKASPAERKKLRVLEAEYERIAPATATYGEMEGWREDEERIRRANEKAAVEEAAKR